MSSRISQGSRRDEQYIICVEGFPSSYTWADVKDLAKTRNATHGLRTHVVERPGRADIWTIKLIRKDEAVNFYAYLAVISFNGQGLIVHLLEGAVHVKSNCQLTDTPCPLCATRQRPQITPPASSQAYAIAAPTTLPVVYSIPLHPATAATAIHGAPRAGLSTAQTSDPQLLAAAQDLQARAAAGINLTSQQAAFLQRMSAIMTQMSSLNISPSNYTAAAASGAPVNTSQGFARTEIRGVFVQGLDYKSRTSEVAAFFSRAGQVARCEIHVDSRGKSKGTATVQFATATQARNAVQGLNGQRLQGKTLRVRSDREAIVTEAPECLSSSESSRHSASSGTMSGSLSMASSMTDEEDEDEDDGPVIVNGSTTRRGSY